MAATKTRPVGRHSPIVKTPEEFEKRFHEYVDDCVANDRRPTITGAAYHRGFQSRQSFYDYENSDVFGRVTQRARLLLESWAEEELFRLTGQVAGSIFWLKNHGWSDRQDVSLDVDPVETARKIRQALAEADERTNAA